MTRKRFALSSVAIAALLSGSVLAGTPNRARAQAPAARAGRGAALANVRMQEAQALVQAYAALVTANHDYQGHRAAAAGAVRGGLKIIEAGIAKHGSAAQQTTMNQQLAAVAAAEQTAKQTPMVKERQAASDAQLAQAQKILAQLQQTLASSKQQRVLAEVNKAIQEIQIALQVR
jgi:hypothetical protein